MSRKSALKGRAVLAYVGFDAPAIAMFYANNPMNEEEAVQTGLLEWASGNAMSRHPTTWKVLIGAMHHAEISKQTVEELKAEIGEERKAALCVCMYFSILNVVTVHRPVVLKL